MSIRTPALRGFVTLSVALWGAARMEAQLAAKSPFMPAATAGTAAATTGAPLEYRGIMQTAQGLKARVVDPSRRSGAWLLVNERDPAFDFVVKQIDLEHDTVTVDYQGRALTLAQHVAKVTSAGVAPNFPGAMPNPAANMPPAIAGSVVVNPTPADEQRRLEAVASEVARRRQMREQAAQQSGQAGPAAPPMMQPPPNANPQNVGPRVNPRARGTQP